MGEGDLLAVAELAQQRWVLRQTLAAPHSQQWRQRLALLVQFDALPSVTASMPIGRSSNQGRSVWHPGLRRCLGWCRTRRCSPLNPITNRPPALGNRSAATASLSVFFRVIHPGGTACRRR